jgi:pimeloyl-ACP methyl ester carboxylesterase
MRLGVSHQECVRSVVSYIQQQRLEQVILVGHSFGGSVIQKVAEEIPSLIERTVFLDALIVEDGRCVFDELPAEYVALFNDLARESSDNTMLIPWEVWRDNFIQDAPEHGARSLWEQLSPEPNQVNLDRLDLRLFTRSPFQGALSTADRIKHCRRDTFIPGCRHAWENSNCLKWMAATRLCLRARKNWQTKSSKQASIDREAGDRLWGNMPVAFSREQNSH